MGVLHYADGLHFVWLWAGLGYGVWLVSDLVNGLIGWLGIGFADSWFTGFVQSAKWSGYSRVGKSDLLFGHDFFDATISGHS